MANLSKEMVEKIKKSYPSGTRVELVKMDDVQAPPVGTRGTVEHVDDNAQIHVSWDNGSSLALIVNEDAFEKVDYQLSISYRDVSECVCIAYDYNVIKAIAESMASSVKDGKIYSESGSVIERIYIETFDKDKDDNVIVWEYSQES